MEFSTTIVGASHTGPNHFLDKGSKMNSIVRICWVTIIAVSLITVANAAGETKRVCKTDEKTKKEVCKDIKVHKKLEGTPVPDKSAKK
jgi:hypothetical protein